MVVHSAVCNYASNYDDYDDDDDGGTQFCLQLCIQLTRVNRHSDQRQAPVHMKPLLFFVNLLLFFANANREGSKPSSEIANPEDQNSKVLRKEKDREKKEVLVNSFYEIKDPSYNDEYEGDNSGKDKGIGRDSKAKKNENRAENLDKEKLSENVSTALLKKENSKLEDELLRLLIDSEPSWKKNTFGHTWKEIVELARAPPPQNDKLNRTALMEKHEKDLKRMEESLTNIEKKIIDQVIDHARLQEAKDMDAKLEKRIMGWKTDVEGDHAAPPNGQQGVEPLVDDIHR